MTVYFTLFNKTHIQHVSSYQNPPAFCLLRAAGISSWSLAELMLIRFSVERCSDVFLKKRTQDASKLLCIKAFLSRRMLVTESWVISPHFLFFFQYNSAKAFQTFASLCFSLMNTKHDVSLIELLHRGCFYTTQIYYLSVPFLLFWINLVQRDSKTNKVCSLWPGSR